MSKEKNLENVKKLREITGVGFKDCKLALDENNGDIDSTRIATKKFNYAIHINNLKNN